jgi:hypothetical protein
MSQFIVRESIVLLSFLESLDQGIPRQAGLSSLPYRSFDLLAFLQDKLNRNACYAVNEV